MRLPNNWRPRDYQLPAWNYLERGGLRLVLRWHRRAGKDDICLHHTACKGFERVGNYWHMLPKYEQARKAIWEAVNPHSGKRRIDEAFPPELRKTTREAEMFIELLSGSTWRPVGSDNFNALIGSPPVGLTFSEYAVSDPTAWDYLRPILAENGGWAIFNSTVRGRNHFWKLGDYARTAAGWCFDQKNADETGVFTADQLHRERMELIAIHGEDYGDAVFQQEYFNDPSAAFPGAYFAKAMAKADREGRIRAVPHDDMLQVHTSVDLGMDDYTVIWFWQVIGAEVRVIDLLAFQNTGLTEIIGAMHRKPYRYGVHYAPHDAQVRELGSGKSRLEVADRLGLKWSVVPQVGLMSGIDQARSLIGRCYFDADKCARGIEALQSYHSEYDEARHVQSLKPVHDWTSHYADAFRYFAVGTQGKAPDRRKIDYTAMDRAVI